jgi:phosphatidylserine/phosphatidylglycerophosphate/cardiolipin synthase-like enzyme
MQAGYGLSAGPISEAVGFAVARGVRVDVISSAKSLQTVRSKFAARSLIRSFRPKANLADERLIGSHAKFCVRDGVSGYIGSANLTGPGLAGQIEIGVLIRGEIAKQLEELCDYCIQVGIFLEQPNC